MGYGQSTDNVQLFNQCDQDHYVFIVKSGRIKFYFSELSLLELAIGNHPFGTYRKANSGKFCVVL